VSSSSLLIVQRLPRIDALCAVEARSSRQLVHSVTRAARHRGQLLLRRRVMSRPVTEDAPLSVVATVDDGVARVTLQGELDLDRAGAVAAQLADLAGQGATSVVVDASGLNFIDSSGLRALLSAREQLEAAGASLQLTDLSPAVERVLEMTGTRTLLTGT
jgi:stage II sporulation protein AA (anti-sigma F factor antagonist)